MDKTVTAKGFTPEEVKWIDRARAVARRAALREATELCDHIAKQIEEANPGRKKGDISKAAFDSWLQVKRCGEEIWKMREATEVPQ